MNKLTIITVLALTLSASATLPASIMLRLHNCSMPSLRHPRNHTKVRRTDSKLLSESFTDVHLWG